LELEQTSRGNKVYKLVKCVETIWNSRLVLGARIHKLTDEIKDTIETVVKSTNKEDVRVVTKYRALEWGKVSGLGEVLSSKGPPLLLIDFLTLDWGPICIAPSPWMSSPFKIVSRVYD
jgi:hypothetical protein